jgi:hypothetical protein
MIVDPRSTETLDLLGPTIGVTIPLHSHPEPETFLATAGGVDGLVPASDTRSAIAGTSRR